MPDDLRVQIERIRQVVDAFNIPRLEMEGFEADDVLGSAAHWAAAQGLGVKIITGDRDLLQLVNQRTIVYLAGDDQNYITPEDVLAKLHVRPEQVVDYKALVAISLTIFPAWRVWERRPPKFSWQSMGRWMPSTPTLMRSSRAGAPSSQPGKNLPT